MNSSWMILPAFQKAVRKKAKETTPPFVFYNFVSLYSLGKPLPSSFVLLQICKVLQATKWNGAANPFQSLRNTVWYPRLWHSKCNCFSLWREERRKLTISLALRLPDTPFFCPSFWNGSHVRLVDVNSTGVGEQSWEWNSRVERGRTVV